jgi:DUF1680 family protein
MRTRRYIFAALSLVVIAIGAVWFVRNRGTASDAPDYPVKPVPFTAVHLTDEFWAPRIETNRRVSIPAAMHQLRISGRIDLFERAAAVLEGKELANKEPPGYPFDDTDVYKVIGGASYSLQVAPDPGLDAHVDDLIAKIGAAQEEDGYLYTTRTINPERPHAWAGINRWEEERNESHELYNLGHLFEAAVAHYQATGKRSLLDIAVRSADLLVATFGPGKQSIWPGHQITEMGLVKLYRVTGKREYLDLAAFLLDERGKSEGVITNSRGLEYNQAHVHVTEQSEPVGHAVRAMYMYAGMADVAALRSDALISAAGNRIWENLVSTKMYVTGGIGSTSTGEAFGEPYELPNMTAYNETCASIGMDFWNHRLSLLHGDARYVDVMERTLYNALLSGVSLEGDTFFYPNPLASRGQHQRQEWFGVACCPGNVTRFMPSVPGYVYAYDDDTIYVNLFAAGKATVEMGGERAVTLTQETRYPWDGAIRMTVEPGASRDFAINVRIPGWTRDEPVPSNLYRFLDEIDEPVTLSVNGETVPIELQNGYVELRRTWHPGDVISLNLPMPVRRVVAHEEVEADRGRVALQRGPIVYAAEWPDNPGGRVRNLVLADNKLLHSEFRGNLLRGVQVITSRATALAFNADGNITRTEQELTAIPYFAWANRGPGEMAVWLARTEAAATPAPSPTIATTSEVATSGRKDPRAVNDGEAPSSSDDSSFTFDWQPSKGTTEWVEYAFKKSATVSEAQVYWFEDASHGEVNLPASWRVLYKDGQQWKAVDARNAYSVEKDRFNIVTFTPVTTSGLRLEVTMQPESSAGLQEWRVR